MQETVTEKPHKGKSKHPAIVAHFRAVGKISLYTGLVTAICLVLTIYYLAGIGVKEGGYAEIFSSYALSKRQLGPAMLVAGLLLVAVTGVITWIIILYSTFRVAGPLHRFAANLDEQIMSGPVPVSPQYPGSALHDEHLRFSGGASRLQLHYDTMSELADLARAQLELPEVDLGNSLTKTVEQLRETHRLVKV